MTDHDTTITQGLDDARRSLVQVVRALQEAHELEMAGEAFVLLNRVVRAQGARLRARRAAQVEA